MTYQTHFKQTLIASALAAACTAVPEILWAAQVGPPITIATTDNGFFSPPALASSTHGFVVGWTQRSDGLATFYVSAFAPDGGLQNSNVEVGSATASDFVAPGLSMDADGDFVTAWEKPDSEKQVNRGSLYARRYAAGGVAKGDPSLVSNINDYLIDFIGFRMTDLQLQFAGARVAMDDDGDFVVAWGENGHDSISCRLFYDRTCLWTDSYSRIYVATFGADGTAIKQKTLINRTGSRSEELGSTSQLIELSMVGTDGDFETVISGGTKRGAEMPLTLTTFNEHIVKSGAPAALSNVTAIDSTGSDAAGNIYALWYDSSTGGSRVSRFAPSGVPLGPDIVLPRSFISIAVAPSGAFALLSDVCGYDSGGHYFCDEIDGQYFNADGSPHGEPFVISPGNGSSQNTDHYMTGLTSTLDSSGQWTVVWRREDDRTDGSSPAQTQTIFARIVTGP